MFTILGVLVYFSCRYVEQVDHAATVTSCTTVSNNVAALVVSLIFSQELGQYFNT